MNSLPRLILGLLLTFSTCLSFAQDVNRVDENGLKQGTWKKMHSNGRVRYEGQFENDKPVGLFKYYYENGALQATNNHVGDGTVANHVYHPNGKIKAKGIFRGTLKDSLWQYYNNQEHLVLEETYRNDTLNGVQKTYYENGQLGEEIHFRMGEKQGPWLKFFDNAKPWVDGFYEKGNLHGEFKMYFEDGKPKIKGKYEKGIRTGWWLMYNDNGSVKTQDKYVDGILKQQKYENGEFTEYYENEIPKSVYNYKKGKKNGEFSEFYEKGEWVSEEVPGKFDGPKEVVQHLEGTQVKVKGWYLDDQLNGKVTYYKEDGSVDRVEVWENGTLVSTIDWEGVKDE